MGNKPGSQGGGGGAGGAGGASDRKPPNLSGSASSRSGSGSMMGDSGSINSSGHDDSAPGQITSSSSEEQNREAAIPLAIDSVSSLDFMVELCGGKGWPTNAHAIYYHAPLGLVVVGTEGGVVFAYGDGFQYMRALCALSDDGAIFEASHIVALADDRIAVVLGNNSIHVLSLPLLDVVASLPAGWLSKRYGDISAVSYDPTNRRPYVYIGTSEGFVRVLEVSSFIRVSEFHLSLADTGLTGNLLVSSIQVCPKNDRYLAVGYDGDSSTLGAVAIFDLTKRKPHRIYKIDAVTSITWNHTGELLFAGTRTGEVVSLGFDKQFSTTAWRCDSQLITQEGSEGHLMVRSIRWMPPITESPSETGCMFVLIGSFGVDAENLRSVLVALATSEQNGSLQEILGVPPLHGEEVTSFLVASSWDRSGTDAAKIVPCLLFLTQSSFDDSDTTSHNLKFLRCPESPISQWILEISLTNAPRSAIEVLPGLTSVTAMCGLTPSASSNDSLSSSALRESAAAPRSGNILLRGASSPAPAISSPGPGAKRRASQRDFFKDIPGFDEDMTDSWELVMGSGTRDAVDALDTIVLGHEDGSVVVWGVARSPAECTGLGESSSGTSWIPLRALRLSHASVTAIAQNTAAGIIAAGDSEGNVVVWHTSSDELSGSSGETLNQTLSLRFPDEVTSIAITPSTIFVGTKSGRVFFANFSAPAATAVASMSRLGGILGSVAHLVIAPYWALGCGYTNVSALYVSYSNGFLAILNAETKELCGFTKSNASTTTQVEVSEGDSGAPSCLKFDNTGRAYYPVCFGGVFSSSFELASDAIKEPEKESERAADSDDSDEDVPEPAPVPATTGKKKSDNKSPSNWIARSIMKSSSSSDASKNAVNTTPRPNDAPKYFVRVCNKTVVLFDLSKISVPPTPKKSDFIEAQAGIAKIVYNFDESIVGASLVSYVEDAARFWSSPFCTLSCVDLNSTMYDLAFTSKDLRMLCCINLLQDKLSTEVELRSSIVLPNGRIYMQQNGLMIFTATPQDTKYVPVQGLPARCRTHCITPTTAALGATSPETAALKRKASRMSIIGLGTAAPAELDKLFAKTYDQLLKDDLLYMESIKAAEVEEENDDIQKHQIAQAIKASASVKSNVMDETRQAFEERGRRLQELSEKTAKLSLTAAEYRAHTSAQKERLRRKAQRWGLF